MRMSHDGLKFLMNEEGFENNAYPDPATHADPWTIGVGHTGPEVHPGLYWPNDKVLAALREDVSSREDAINKAVRVQLNQDQFDVLGDFVFNTSGPDGGAFVRSTLLRLLNAGNYQGAADEFLHWNIPSLLIPRRQRERAKFMGAAVVDTVPPHITISKLSDVQTLVGVEPDGLMGPVTRAAIIAWQGAHGLSPDGIVGPKTLAAMGLV